MGRCGFMCFRWCSYLSRFSCRFRLGHKGLLHFQGFQLCVGSIPRDAGRGVMRGGFIFPRIFVG